MKKTKSLFTLLSLLTIALVFTACSSNTKTVNTTMGETITISHLLGETTVNKNPETVVVFDYGILDSLDKMEVEVTGLPKASLPAFLDKFNESKYIDVGTLKEPNFEKIFELNPDVIFISGRQQEAYEELSKIAPTIYFELDGSKYMESVTKNIKTLGEIFDKKEFVETELANINKAIEDLSKEVKKHGKNALILLANDGAISAYGQDSRFGIIHGDFGFTPVDAQIEASNHGQSVTFEYILEKNPDYLFIIDRAAVTGGSSLAKQIFDNEIIKQTKAYQNNNIIYLNAHIWYVGSGGLNGTMKMIDEIKSNN